MSGLTPWPTEIRVDAARSKLTVIFDSGEQFVLPAEYLRVESPSAEVQGHTAAQKQLVAGKHGVKIVSLEPVGNYATRIHFDDGHDTGLYSWDYLHELGRDQPRKWDAYLSALRAKKLAR
ncbi:MAG TPA: DUF971 domain-containing protein [Rhizomicrobium sp.]|jgi:DUF971 family protein|nr:DUF971 domain-containing protein [Rhizomicrobium sp.]